MKKKKKKKNHNWTPPTKENKRGIINYENFCKISDIYKKKLLCCVYRKSYCVMGCGPPRKEKLCFTERKSRAFEKTLAKYITRLVPRTIHMETSKKKRKFVSLKESHC